MWGVGAAGFFAGFDRFNPRSWGRKGCFFALIILVLAAVLLWLLSEWIGMAGVALFALIVLVVSWVPISRVERENRLRRNILAREVRSAAVTDSDFKLGESTPEAADQSQPPGAEK